MNRLSFATAITVFLLLISCNSGLFVKTPDPKPYYFSKVKNSGAYHTPKKSKQTTLVSKPTAADSVISKLSETIPEPFFSATATNPIVAPAEPVKIVAIKPNIEDETDLSSKAQKPAHQKVKTTKKTDANDGWFLGGTALLTLLSVSLLSLFIPKTRGLASWAKENPKRARTAIAGGQLITGFGAYFIGRHLADFGVATTEATTYPLIAFATLAMLAYPAKNRNRFVKYSYKSGKQFSFLLLLSSFLLFLNIGNREVTDKNFNPTSKQISEAAGSSSYADWQETFKRPQLENSPKKLTDGIAALLFLLAILGFAAIIIGVAALSCSLACSNQGVLAVFVAIGGAWLAVYLLIIAMRAIDRGSKEREALRPPKEIKEKKPFKEEFKWF